ncbi:cell division protein ZapB [Marinomonas aquiplantarum]|uniref:Cell division protein ZapB n=1 Tax=Marinomonas aquiplantarum TaxID=491951 RepID=A0A366CX11_9GAMM|nr:cell division protein ZapB [Marinomonas aquiplantarum]RBO80011.1 cell division protein ZapB [Marinomonas aquiplantarum]
MNNELLHHLEQRINEAVEEIGSLRKRIADLEMQNYELNEEKSELQSTLDQTKEQQSNWESSLSQMLSRLNQMDNKQ